MTDDQFRELRTLILDLGVKIEAQSLSIKALQKKITKLEADGNAPQEVPCIVVMPENIKDFLEKRLPPEAD